MSKYKNINSYFHFQNIKESNHLKCSNGLMYICIKYNSRYLSSIPI